MMAHTCDTITWETETGGLLWIQGQPDLQSEILSSKQNKNFVRDEPLSLLKAGALPVAQASLHLL